MTPSANNSLLEVLLQPFNADIGSMGRCTVLLEPLSVQSRVESSLKLIQNLSRTSTYRSEFTVIVTPFLSKKNGPIIPLEDIATHAVTLHEWSGLSATSTGGEVPPIYIIL